MFKDKINKIRIPLDIRSRLGFMWFLTFFYQAGFVIAWIAVTAVFIEFFGIKSLLWLFLVEAFLIFLSSVLSHFYLQKQKNSRILYYVLAIVLAILFLGIFLQNSYSNQIEFLFLAIVAKSFFYPHLRIGILRKTEELFTPLQAEKSVPIIDSALTIGLVVTAGILLFLLDIFELEATQNILFLWLFPLLAICVMLFFEKKVLKKIPRIYPKEDLYEEGRNNFRQFFGELKKTKFLKFLVIVVLLQSVLYTVTEFEFLKTIDSHFHHEPIIHLDFTFLQTNIFSDIQQGAHEIYDLAVEEIEHTASQVYAHETLAHDLTGLSLVFGIFALFIQFLITPLVLSKLGISNSILIYFAGFLVMTISFLMGGSLPINLVRGYEHSCHSLFMSAYHISFYSVVERSREFLRHLIEGMIVPLGIILGVMLVFTFRSLGLDSVMPSLIVSLTGFVFVVSFYLPRYRTQIAQENLAEAENISEKIKAIEVLGQKGQLNSSEILVKELLNKKNDLILREKIIETLKKVNDIRTVHTYIKILEDHAEHETIKARSLEAMLEIENLREYSGQRHFMRFKTVRVMQNLFAEVKDSYLKKLVVMNIFQHLPASEVVPFFNQVMNSDDEKMQSVCLRSCEMFDDPDVIHFVEPYLEHSSYRVRSHAVMALWKYCDRSELRKVMQNLLSQSDREAKIAGIYAIGEVDDYKSLEKLYSFSREEDLEIRLHSLVARAKMGDRKVISGISEILFSADEDTAHKIFNMLKRGVPEKFSEKLREEIHNQVSSRVREIISVDFSQDDPSLSVLNYLKRLYHFAGKHDELIALKQNFSV